MAKSVKANIILKTCLNVFNFAIPIFVGPYLARTLDVISYSEYNKALSLCSWLIPLAQFGIYNYGMRAISQARQEKNDVEVVYSSLLYIGFIMTIFSTVLYWLYCGKIISGNNKGIYYIASLQIIANIFSIEWVNEGFENYGFIVKKTLLTRCAYVIAIFAFVRKETDIIPFTFVASIAIVLNNFFSFLFIIKKFRLIHVKMRQLIPYIRPLGVMFLLSNSSLLYTALDRVFLSSTNSGIEITYYVFSQNIINMVTNILNAIILVPVPRLAFYIAQGKNYEFNSLQKNTSRLYFFLIFPISIGFAVLSRQIMYLYGGEKYVLAGIPFFMFSIRNIVNSLDLCLKNQILYVNGKEKELTKIYFIGGFFNIILNILLFKMGKVTAFNLIFTTMLAEICVIVFEKRCILKYINLDIKAMGFDIKRYLLTSLIFFPIAWIVSLCFPSGDSIDIVFLLKVSLIILTCSFVYLLILFMMKDDAMKMIYDYASAKLEAKRGTENDKKC